MKRRSFIRSLALAVGACALGLGMLAKPKKETGFEEETRQWYKDVGEIMAEHMKARGMAMHSGFTIEARGCTMYDSSINAKPEEWKS